MALERFILEQHESLDPELMETGEKGYLNVVPIFDSAYREEMLEIAEATGNTSYSRCVDGYCIQPEFVSGEPVLFMKNGERIDVNSWFHRLIDNSEQFNLVRNSVLTTYNKATLRLGLNIEQAKELMEATGETLDIVGSVSSCELQSLTTEDQELYLDHCHKFQQIISRAGFLNRNLGLTLNSVYAEDIDDEFLTRLGFENGEITT